MPNNVKHIALTECRQCIVLMQDTFAGVLSDRQPNNCRLRITKPIAYFQGLGKELNDNLAKRGVKGTYTVSIKVSPKDHRTFLSAEFRYGRRVLKYTNVSAIAHQRTKETTTFCIKESTVTATRTIRPAGSAAKWVQEHTEAWTKAGYKGRFSERETNKGLIYIGNFKHKKEDKKIKITSRYTGKKSVVFTLEQTYTVTENIYTNDNPQDFVRDTRKAMKADKFQGDIRTFVNSQDRLVIDGRYTKTVKVDNGTNAYVVLFYNQTERVKSVPVEGWESWKPTKKIGKSFAQVRSIAQDDTYTPEFTGKKINWDHIEIEKLYREYLQMPASELELAEKRLESMDERAATKGDKTAQKWLRSLKKSRPAWLQAPNAYSLALYCVKYLQKEVMTPSEATNFCKRYAYKKD